MLLTIIKKFDCLQKILNMLKKNLKAVKIFFELADGIGITLIKVALFTEKVREGKMFAKKWGSDK